ncbi:hypothetical protein [Afipia sp. GAS231]|uniref:hypothetical protein n=1 Tax=Afipia sp. GAS231 TaxID=1882747 RepID=UPI00087A3913|nr:hypothetical protein [Afipia sp. GAS231]SDO48599.1 hypothetical protein SAMN05444050_4253 [Afipia sp. GAS231]
MRLEPTPLGFTYKIIYVPKGAQNPRTALLGGTDTAVVRHIEPAEAAPAFRIQRPKLDIWPLTFPRKPRDDHRGLTKNAFTLELLFYENVIWWPYLSEFRSRFEDHTAADCLSQFGSRLKERTAAECLEDIGTDFDLFEPRYVDYDSSDFLEEPPAIRTLVETDHDQKLAIAKRKAYENFLICGDRPYVRGGLPVFFRNVHGNKEFVWEIEVGSAGSDRRGDPWTHGLQDPPGSFLELGAERAFGGGAFWLPNEFAAARFAGHGRQTKFPQIEVLMPELIVDVRQQIRLDSLFREVVRLLRYHTRGRVWTDSRRRNSRAKFYLGPWKFRTLEREFDKLCDPVLDDRELSKRRLDLLRTFAVTLEERLPREMYRIQRDIISFGEQEQRSPTWPVDLAREDEEAIGSLGS